MQILNHLLLTEGLSFRHTGWHSTELQPSSTHPSPHRSQDSASAAHGQGLCAHSGPQRLRTGVGVTLLGPGAEMSLCSPARSCPPALATAARHGLQPRGCRPSIPQPPRVRVLPERGQSQPKPSPRAGCAFQPCCRRSRSPRVPAAQKYPCGGRAAPSLLPRRRNRPGLLPQPLPGRGLRLTGDVHGGGRGAGPALRGRERQHCCTGRARRVRFQRSNPKPAHPDRRSKASSLHWHRALDLI